MLIGYLGAQVLSETIKIMQDLAVKNSNILTAKSIAIQGWSFFIITLFLSLYCYHDATFLLFSVSVVVSFLYFCYDLPNYTRPCTNVPLSNLISKPRVVPSLFICRDLGFL